MTKRTIKKRTNSKISIQETHSHPSHIFKSKSNSSRRVHAAHVAHLAHVLHRNHKLLRKNHKKAITLFHKTVNLENALKKQITDCLNKVYYKDILDRTTNTLLLSIPDILDHLFTHYGEVEASTLIQERD